MSSVIERYLAADHVRLDRLLRQLLDAPPDAPVEMTTFTQFRSGLLRHIGLEEKVLLPHARRYGTPALMRQVAELRIEHAALASLLVPTPDHALVREIAELLEVHNRREEGEHGVYAECVAIIGTQERDVMLRMEAIGEPPLAPHFDGPGTVRTGKSALALAEGAAARRRTA